MSGLELTNTLSGGKAPFTPRTAGRVKFFSCGPSVYRHQHLGNFRTYLFAEMIHSYLEFSGYTVERVINFTDVEDKAIDEAEQRGVSLASLRRPVESAFFRDCELLGIHLPDTIPRASTSVDQAVRLIHRLLDRGHAYRHEGDVFFDPLTYEGFGRLFGLDMQRWPKKRIRFRQDTYPGQRWNRGDFILWHKRRKQDGPVWWESDFGPGRPAWNIQDAAMISKHLGDEIDLHTGGVDNLYRHHDYTLAIMEGASGKRFCPWWLHGGHLLVDGNKMSKSRGNVTGVDDLLARGFRPRHIRFFLMYAPYREPLDLRLSTLEARAGRLDRTRNVLARLLEKRGHAAGDRGPDPSEALLADFTERMNDDLDYAGAFDAVAEHLTRAAAAFGDGGMGRKQRKRLIEEIRKVDKVLGVFGNSPAETPQ